MYFAKKNILWAFVDQYVLLLSYNFSNIINDVTECRLTTKVELRIELCK